MHSFDLQHALTIKFKLRNDLLLFGQMSQNLYMQTSVDCSCKDSEYQNTSFLVVFYFMAWAAYILWFLLTLSFHPFYIWISMSLCTVLKSQLVIELQTSRRWFETIFWIFAIFVNNSFLCYFIKASQSPSTTLSLNSPFLDFLYLSLSPDFSHSSIFFLPSSYSPSVDRLWRWNLIHF